MGGKCAYLRALADISSEFRHIDYVPAPFHLSITQMAHIGIVAYSFERLNDIFCAPNKIFEYSMCGFPMLCNDVGGLLSTVGDAGAGECVDFAQQSAILRGLQEISSDHEAYSERSLRFYESVDMYALHSEMLDRYECAR